MDDTWRQVIRKLGGDDRALCGPTHDDLVKLEKEETDSIVTSWLGGHLVESDILDE